MAFIAGYMILDDDGALVCEKWDGDAGRQAVCTELDGLPDGEYWTVRQRLENGRPVCRLARLERSEDEHVKNTLFESITSRLVFNHWPAERTNKHFSDRFLFPLFELQRPALERRGVPQAVADCFFIGQATPLADLATMIVA